MSANGGYESPTRSEQPFDPVLLAVLANRLETVVREMTNTLLRTGRSAVLNTARDFSCSIVTQRHELLAAGQGLPIHVVGSQFLSESLDRLQADIAPGDAFLHNDPYNGNTHAADHSILVPVFHEGEHVFTAVAKAHQADCGNAAPTTYSPFAKDVYEEGAPIFPCVRVQRDRRDLDDVIRMCKARIRVPEVWYGDYLATLAAARIGERRLREILEEYGGETISQFVSEWFDYAERRTIAAIKEMPSGEVTITGSHDPVPPVLPEPVPLRVTIRVDAAAGLVEVDLRDNPDCLDAGLNLTEATAMAAAVTGVLNQLPDVPATQGTFGRIRVQLRENCVAGIPRHPHSCSVATTNIADRIINLVQRGLSELGDSFGLAEGGVGMGPATGVISGRDGRRAGRPFINQLILGANGGPASPVEDGWISYGLPGPAGLLYRDSIEIDEQKYPVRFHEVRLAHGSEGAGRLRGAPGVRVTFGPTEQDMEVGFLSDGSLDGPRGVHGGQDGAPREAWVETGDGRRREVPPIGSVTLTPGERIVDVASGGGGYGPPAERDPIRVARDVTAGRLTPEAAREIYRVELRADNEANTWSVDTARTAALRAGPRDQ